GVALTTARLELLPLPSAAAGVLPDDRETAARLLGVALSPDWPQSDLLDVLPLQAAAGPDAERFGGWGLIGRGASTGGGDGGFMGPPGEDRTVEIGYSVVPERQGRGYASEAVRALVAWALAHPQVAAVVAESDLDNAASIRVLERVGFACTGERQGRLCWR